MDASTRVRIAPTKDDLDDLLEALRAWVRFTNLHRTELRDARRPRGRRLTKQERQRPQENLMEHCGQLGQSTLYAFPLFEEMRFVEPNTLDAALGSEYALIHDTVELIAKDTPLFRSTPEQRATKVKREQQAMTELVQMWQRTAPRFVLRLVQYHAQNDLESRAVRALDKIIATLNIWENGGDDWIEQGVTYEVCRDFKLTKVREAVGDVSELQFLYDLTVHIFEKLGRAPALFYRT